MGAALVVFFFGTLAALIIGPAVAGLWLLTEWAIDTAAEWWSARARRALHERKKWFCSCIACTAWRRRVLGGEP